MPDKTLIFRVKRPGEKELVTPRWLKVTAKNAECPECKDTMIVVNGHGGILYGYCLKCRQYYLGG